MCWLPLTVNPRQKFERNSPALSADVAFRLFCLPNRSERRATNHRQLVERARFHLRRATWQRIRTAVGEMQTYTFMPDTDTVLGTVLVVHGWTSESSFMTAMAEPIRRLGYRVVLMDLPAHGFSDGRSTNLIDCARAVAEVGRAVGPLHAVVAHSIGGLISLVAAEGVSPMPCKLEAPNMVLIASPNRLADFTRVFCKHWGVDAKAERGFVKRLERLGKRSITEYSAERLARINGARVLVVHGHGDHDVRYSCAKEIAAGSKAELIGFDGLGHRDILFASQAVRHVSKWIHAGAQPRLVQTTTQRVKEPVVESVSGASLAA
jgi:esterase/lipase